MIGFLIFLVYLVAISALAVLVGKMIKVGQQ